MPLLYNNKKIIPAPLVNVSKQYNRSGDGTKLGVTYLINLIGTLLPQRGSPVSIPVNTNYVTNGNFDTDLTGWPTTGTVSWFNQRVRIQASSTIQQQITGLTVGTQYKINLDIVSFIDTDGTGLNVKVSTDSGGSGNILNHTFSQTGVKEVLFTPTASTVWLRFTVAASDEYQIDTISVTLASSLYDGNFWIGEGEPACEVLEEDELMGASLRKQESIRCLFADDGKLLEITPLDGSTPATCNPRVININFQEGTWVDKCDYTIQLEADVMYGSAMCTVDGDDNFNEKIVSADESWTFEFAEAVDQTIQHFYRVTHTVTAQGKAFYDEAGVLVSPSYVHAKNYVESKLGYDDSVRSNSLLLIEDDLTVWNQVRSENINELNGTVSVTESFILSNSGASEDFNVSTRTSLEDGKTSVLIDGIIIGFENISYNTTTDLNTVTATKYVNALAKFNSIESSLISRAQTYSGISGLNAIVKNKVIGKNPVSGVITYSYEYDNRPSNCISGARFELITITDQNPGDIIARIPVLGRAAGPILQDIGTKTERVRQVSCEAVMTQATQANCNYSTLIAQKPNVDSIVDQVEPTGVKVFKTQDDESWSPSSLRYTRQVTWIWEQ